MFHCPVEVWVIEQRAIILSATVRSPTVITATRGGGVANDSMWLWAKGTVAWPELDGTRIVVLVMANRWHTPSINDTIWYISNGW